MVVRMMALVVLMMLVLAMLVLCPEDEDANAINNEADDSHKYGLVEYDVHRVEQPVNAFPNH